MPLVEEPSFDGRSKHIRGSGRLNSRVAVAVEWIEGGQILRKEGYTVDISSKGCLAVVPHGIAVGERVKLVNLISQISCDAVLIWRGHEGRTGWELGLQLENPSPDFWGLDF